MRKLIITLFILATATAAVISYYLGHTEEYGLHESWLPTYMVAMFSLVTVIFLYSAAVEFKWFKRWTKNVRGYETNFKPTLNLIPSVLFMSQKSSYNEREYREHTVVFVIPVFGVWAHEWKYDLPIKSKTINTKKA